MTTTKEETKHTDEKQKAPVYTVDHPEFPKLLYNAKARTTAAAKDKDDEEKLKGKGFSEEPYPPVPDDAMTPQEIDQLVLLLKKTLAEVSKYGKLHVADAGETGNHPAAGASGKPPAR